MIRQMQVEDLKKCGEIYAQAFPIEHWGIDWDPDNARAYLADFFEQKKFVGYVYEENGEIVGCVLHFVKFQEVKESYILMKWLYCPKCRDKVLEEHY